MHPSLKLLSGPSLHVPMTQDPGRLTEDMVDERQAELIAMGESDEGMADRAHFQVRKASVCFTFVSGFCALFRPGYCAVILLIWRVEGREKEKGNSKLGWCWGAVTAVVSSRRVFLYVLTWRPSRQLIQDANWPTL